MLRVLLLLSVSLLFASAATTTSAVLVTPPPTISGMVVRVKINGVYVDFAGCNISSFGDVACSSDIGHDVTVTPLESTGLEWWFWLLRAIIGLLIAILTAVYLCGLNDARKKRRIAPYSEEAEGYQPVPVYTSASTRIIGVAIERPSFWLPEGPVMA